MGAISPGSSGAFAKNGRSQAGRRSSVVIGKQRAERNEIRLLSAVKAGEKTRLVHIDAGRRLNGRLAALGFVPEAEITVLSNGYPGAFLVMVKDVKMALGRGVAHKIRVK